METKIKIVSESAEISTEEAKMALELADGSIERAFELVPYVEKSIVIVHGRFVCGKTTKLYGIFRMVGHGKEGQLYDLGLAMSYSPTDVDSPINATPEAFKKIITELFKQTETNQVHSFLAGFYEQIGIAQVFQMYNYVREQRTQELHDFFSEMIGRIWGGSERLEVEVVTYLLTKVQCEKKGLLQPDLPPDDEIGEEGSSLTIYLETEPMISPVKGKTIDKFASNELIPVKIVDKREAGRYLGSILSNVNGFALGQFKDVYYNEISNRYQVTVEFGPKMYGRFVIDPSVRLATYTDVSQAAPLQQPDSEELSIIPGTISMNQNSILLVFAGLLLIFFIFFALSR